jgi:hypothetical protein
MIGIRDVQEGDLPESLKYLISQIGYEAAMKLQEAFCGRRIHVPLGTDNEQGGRQKFEAIAAVAGEDAALKMIGMYGGTYIEIPTCKQAISKANVRFIMDLRRKGKSIDEMVEATRQSRRQVLYYLQRGKAMKAANPL